MSTSFKTRLRALEQRVGSSGECTCKDSFLVWYATDETGEPTGPEPSRVCSICGGTKRAMLVVKYVTDERPQPEPGAMVVKSLRNVSVRDV